MSRIFSADYIFTLDGREPLRDAFVEVAGDGTVLSTGSVSDLSAPCEHFEGAIVPGFVNSHCHIELSYLKGLFPKGTGMAGFVDLITSIRDMTPLGKRVELVRQWMDTLWERGVSAMGDISNSPFSFPVKAASPLYTRTFLEVFSTEKEDVDKMVAQALDLAEKAREAGIDAAPTPHAYYTMHPDLVTAVCHEGLKSGFLSYHSEESPQEVEMLRYGRGKMWESRRANGMTMPPVTGGNPIQYFVDRLKVTEPLPVEGHVLLVHEVCLDQEGIDLIRQNFLHPYIALCPLSNIYIHNALPPVELMRRNSLKLTIGTDSLSSNDDLDMVKEMFCLQENFPDVPLVELLGWACANGAEFLGKQDTLGSIAPGKKPGIVHISNIGRDGRLTSASASRRLV